MKLRRVTVILVALFMLTSMILVGCKPKDAEETAAPKTEEKMEEATPEPTDAAPEPVEIRATFWSSATRDIIYGGIIDRFMEAYPHVTVKVEGLSFSDYWDKLAVQSASKSEADFIAMHPRYASDFILRGVLAPLDGFIEDGVIDLSEWPQAAIDVGNIGGVQYMLPMGLTVQSFYVNTPMLREYGITIPSDLWTWEDIKTIGLEAAEKFAAAGEEKYFIDDHSGDNIIFEIWVRGRGRELYTEEGTIGFTEQDLADWYTYWNELRDAKVCPPAETTVEYSGTDFETGSWAAGLIAVQRNPSNQIEQFIKGNPYGEELMLADTPNHVDGARSPDILEFGSYSISANSAPEKQLAAAQLLNFWVGTEESYELFGIDQGVPGNVKMVEYLQTILNPAQKQMVDYVAKGIARAEARPFDPLGQTEVMNEFSSIGEQVMFGQMTPEDGAAQLVANATAILAKSQGN